MLHIHTFYYQGFLHKKIRVISFDAFRMYYYIVKFEISHLLQYQCLFNALKQWPDDGLISHNVLSLLSCLVRHV